MTTSKLAIEILRKFYGSNVGVILVEAIPPEQYNTVVLDISEQFKLRLKRPLSKDFLEMILDNHDSIQKELRESQNHLVYNFDLFGKDFDSNKATDVMWDMRASKNMYPQTRQLMIARPEANLDYNSRKGFTYQDNHPLGNWCQFFRVDGEVLIDEQNPIKHRGNKL